MAREQPGGIQRRLVEQAGRIFLVEQRRGIRPRSVRMARQGQRRRFQRERPQRSYSAGDTEGAGGQGPRASPILTPPPSTFARNLAANRAPTANPHRPSRSATFRTITHRSSLLHALPLIGSSITLSLMFFLMFLMFLMVQAKAEEDNRVDMKNSELSATNDLSSVYRWKSRLIDFDDLVTLF